MTDLLLAGVVTLAAIVACLTGTMFLEETDREDRHDD